MLSLKPRTDRVYIRIAEDLHERRRKKEGTVKRDVLMDKQVADRLLRLATHTGVNQGEVIRQLLDLFEAELNSQQFAQAS